MATPTKEELIAQADAAYADFIASATKAGLTALLSFLAETPEERDAGTSRGLYPIDVLIIHDGTGRNTVFNLNDLTIEAPDLGSYSDAIAVSGAGPVMLLDISNFDLYNDYTLEFHKDPHESPILIDFSSGPAPPADEAV